MNFRLVAFRLLSLAALAVCAAMAVDYVLPAPAFCGFRGGCDQVIHSAYGRPLGVPLPIVGLFAFSTFFALTLFPASKPGRLLGPLAIVAGLIGLALAGVQVLILEQTCPFCLMVDVAAILLAAVELGLPQPKEPTQAEERSSLPRPVRRAAWTVLAVLVVAAPALWPVFKPPPEVPDQVKAHWSAGWITVVEITDFSCPYCRQTHQALEQFLQEHGERVRLVRLIVPLEHHENSRPAAQAYRCAERQGKDETMADALFSAGNLSPDAVRELARQMGLDLETYDACMADPTVEAEIDETSDWVDAADLGGLPQIWMQDVLLVGEQTSDSLEAALRRVERTTGK